MESNNLPTNTEINVNELPNIASQLNQKIESNVSNRNVFRIPKTHYIWMIFLVLSITIGSLVGISLGKLNLKETVKTENYTVTKPINVFPIDIAILQNPMFSDWSGRVKGRIKNLKPNTLTLSQIKEEFTPKGKRIVTDVINPNLTEVEITSGTKFFVSSPSANMGSKLSSIVSKQLKVGAIIEGSVRVSYNSSLKTFKLVGITLTER